MKIDEAPGGQMLLLSQQPVFQLWRAMTERNISKSAKILMEELYLFRCYCNFFLIETGWIFLSGVWMFGFLGVHVGSIWVLQLDLKNMREW